MRLICPNCGAQYEVPDEVIPTSGRDVQCSDCGDTWFQHHPDFPAQPEIPPTQDEPDWPVPEDSPTTEPDTALDDAPEVRPEPGPVPTDHGTVRPDPMQHGPDHAAPEKDGFADEEPETHEPARRGLDPSIRELLREEAEREERARQSEMGAALETQQDLGLDEQDSGTLRRSQEARARMARLRGVPDTEPEEAHDHIDPGSRRNLLPDIDDINASLGPDRVRPQQRRSDEASAPKEPAEKRGFRSGFRLSLVLAVVALVIYVFAPSLVSTVPALNEPLAGYVDLVNSGRIALAEMVENLASSLGEGD